MYVVRKVDKDRMMSPDFGLGVWHKEDGLGLDNIFKIGLLVYVYIVRKVD